MTLVLGDESCWLSRLPLVPGEPDANAVIYRKGWYWGQWGWEGRGPHPCPLSQCLLPLSHRWLSPGLSLSQPPWLSAASGAGEWVSAGMGAGMMGARMV